MCNNLVLLAQYTDIPDQNFEQALIDLGIDSEGTLDGRILTANANNYFGSLSISGLGISSLEGLQEFHFINGLDCSNNNITSLVVPGSVLLSWVDCQNNQLTQLDISQTPNWHTLFASNNPDLFCIQVQQYPFIGSPFLVIDDGVEISEDCQYGSTCPLGCSFLISPEPGSTVSGGDVTIEWNEGVNVDGHILTVGTCPTCTDVINNLDKGLSTDHLVQGLPYGDEYFVTISTYRNCDTIVCTTESFTTKNPSFNFYIKDSNENAASCVIRVGKCSTNETIHSRQQANYGFTEPPGCYTVYYRPFRVNAQAVEFQVQLDRDIIDSTIYINEIPSTENYFIDQGWEEDYVFIEESAVLTVEIENAYAIDSIALFTDLSYLSPYADMYYTKSLLYDDGIGNDQMSGDNTFTSSSLFYGLSSNQEFKRRVPYSAFYQVFIGGNSFMYKYEDQRNLALIRKSPALESNIFKVNDEFYFNDYVVNIVDNDPNTAIARLADITNMIYDVFPDEFDFIDIFDLNKGGAQIINYHEWISNSISGIGPPRGVFPSLFDNTAFYGSAGKLKGYNVFPHVDIQIPLNHETMHTWANHLYDDYGGHWGSPSDVGGVLGGNSGSPNGLFSDLELYLMGVLEFDDLRDSFVFGNGQTVTKNDIVAQFGPRVPAPSVGKEFSTLFLVITEEPLTEAGYNWYTYLAKVYEGELDKQSGADILSFEFCAQDLASMRVKLPPVIDPCDVVSIDLATPIDGTYQAINDIESSSTVIGDTYFKAGVGIYLKENFNVDNQIKFEAIIENCNN